LEFKLDFGDRDDFPRGWRPDTLWDERFMRFGNEELREMWRVTSFLSATLVWVSRAEGRYRWAWGQSSRFGGPSADTEPGGDFDDVDSRYILLALERGTADPLTKCLAPRFSYSTCNVFAYRFEDMFQERGTSPRQRVDEHC
jgi:hypothetical protein